jgi:hypothetical protein
MPSKLPEQTKPAAHEYGKGHKLIGKNYQTLDLYAKVTGRSKYAEDYRAEGMLFCKLLLSPVPHGRVKASIPALRWRCPASKESSPRMICPRPPTA